MTAGTFIRSFRHFVSSCHPKWSQLSSLQPSSLNKSWRTLSPWNTSHNSVLSGCFTWRGHPDRWGGLFEHMIRSAKWFLKKAVEKNCLSHDELLTLVTKVEAVLNSRPLTYITSISEDVEEPLTPSHLLVGYRFPISLLEDPNYSPEELTHRVNHPSSTFGKIKEYLLELHYTREEKGSMVGDVVTVYDEGHPSVFGGSGR